MNFYVEDSPENVLSRGEVYFARDWPFGGAYTRTNFSVDLNAYSESPVERFGCLGTLVATAVEIVTLGFKDIDQRTFYSAQILATSHSGGTLLSVNSNREDWLSELQKWAGQQPNARSG